MRTLLQNTLAYQIVKGKVESGKRGHAYLLLFEDEVYLREALRFFATALYRGDSRKTSLIERESFTDVLFLPEIGKKPTVDDASKILEESIVRPIEGDLKLFVIDQFHLANAATQNKLLKVLEEPPEGVCFLLGATSTYPILPTILSRVERLDIPRFSESEIEGFLSRKVGGDVKAAAAVSDGIPSRGEQVLEGGEFASLLSLAKRALSVEEGQIPTLAREIDAFGKKQEFLSVFKLVLRDNLMRELGEKSILQGTLVSDHNKMSLVSSIDLVSKTEEEVKFNANYRQAVEILLVGTYKEKKKWSK